MLLGRLDEDAPAAFEPLLARRLAHEPVAYISGRRAFWTIELEVGPGVLIPRPDSETLIEAAVEHFGAAGPRSVLDLGTGPGTLLLAALDQWPGAVGLGVDSSEAALDFARRNAERLGLADRARFRLGDWAEGVDERFDLILCNPPYVEPDADARARRRGLGAGRGALCRTRAGSACFAGSRPLCRRCSPTAASPASRSAPARRRRSAGCSKRRALPSRRGPTWRG